MTRLAVVGKRRDSTCEDFSGELYAESLDSLYNFFREFRGIMRKFPVGKLKEFKQEHLGVLYPIPNDTEIFSSAGRSPRG